VTPVNGERARVSESPSEERKQEARSVGVFVSEGNETLLEPDTEICSFVQPVSLVAML
jgi:hypothetical protein